MDDQLTASCRAGGAARACLPGLAPHPQPVCRSSVSLEMFIPRTFDMSAPLRRRFYFPNDFLDGLSIEFEDGGAITTNSTQSLQPDCFGDDIVWEVEPSAERSGRVKSTEE